MNPSSSAVVTRNWEDADIPDRDLNDAERSRNQEEAESSAAGGGDILKSKRKSRRVLTEQEIVSNDGIRKIYETFPYQMNSVADGKEAKAVRDLISGYKEWAYDLYPSLAFEDFIGRAERLGRKGFVQNALGIMRQEEARRVSEQMEDNMDTELDRINVEYDAAKRAGRESFHMSESDTMQDTESGMQHSSSEFNSNTSTRSIDGENSTRSDFSVQNHTDPSSHSVGKETLNIVQNDARDNDDLSAL